MHPALPWIVVGALEAAGAATTGGPVGVALAWVGASTLVAGGAYVADRPHWFGKHRRWGALMLPVHLFARGSAWTAQRLGLRERVEVAPGLWVGGWPRRGAPELAQLDLTAELPRRGEALRYANVPMLDGAPAAEHRWRAAVEQAVQWRREGLPVLVHCAYGHGRSVSVLLGVLVAEGLAASFEEAHQLVLRHRPRAKMTAAQRAVTSAYIHRLLSDRRAAPPR